MKNIVVSAIPCACIQPHGPATCACSRFLCRSFVVGTPRAMPFMEVSFSSDGKVETKVGGTPPDGAQVTCFGCTPGQARRLAESERKRTCSKCCHLFSNGDTNMSKCPCGRARYCNAACQKEHWKAHRTECPYSKSIVVEEPDARCSFCQAPQNLGGRMLNCCGNVQYCDRKCQKRHWKLHKTICTLRGAPPAPAYAFHKSISSRLATGEILQILGSDCLETISAALLEHASAEDKPHVEESAIGADAILEDDSSADGIRPRHIRA